MIKHRLMVGNIIERGEVKMITTESEQVIFFDVDETLVLHDYEKHIDSPTVDVVDPYCGTKRKIAYHAPHVRLIKERAIRGAHIKVMSAGGYKWAAAVVEALGLTNSVSECLSKPIAIVDDRPIQQALGDTMYLDPKLKWKSE